MRPWERASIMAFVVAALAALPASASAATVILAPGGRPYQRWVDHAKVPTPPTTIQIEETPCPSDDRTSACTWVGGPIHLVPRRLGPVVRHEFLHELGHSFDYLVMTEWARARFLKIIRDSPPWHAPANSPHEQFAEAWAFCARFGAAKRSRRLRRRMLFASVGYGYALNWRTHRRACALIQNVART